MLRPFRAWKIFVTIDPGRCPGLSHVAPLGLDWRLENISDWNVN